MGITLHALVGTIQTVWIAKSTDSRTPRLSLITILLTCLIGVGVIYGMCWFWGTTVTLGPEGLTQFTSTQNLMWAAIALVGYWAAYAWQVVKHFWAKPPTLPCFQM